MPATGLLNKQIGYELRVSEATIKAHMTAILRKLRVSNRTQAVLVAGRLAHAPCEPPDPGRIDSKKSRPPDDRGASRTPCPTVSGVRPQRISATSTPSIPCDKVFASPPCASLMRRRTSFWLSA